MNNPFAEIFTTVPYPFGDGLFGRVSELPLDEAGQRRLSNPYDTGQTGVSGDPDVVVFSKRSSKFPRELGLLFAVNPKCDLRPFIFPNQPIISLDRSFR